MYRQSSSKPLITTQCGAFFRSIRKVLIRITGIAPDLNARDQVVLGDIGVMYRMPCSSRLALEAVVDQFNHLFFFFAAHAVDEQRSGLIDPDFNP